MKKGLIVFAVLVVLALFAVPALANPGWSKVTWGGKGVTTDDPAVESDVIGDTVHFAGQASLGEPISSAPTWYTTKGHGMFDGTLNGNPIKAKLKADGGRVLGNVDATEFSVFIIGLADVTYLGTKYSNVRFQQNLQESDGEQAYYLYLMDFEPSGSPVVMWIIKGTDVINGGFFKVHLAT